MISLSSSMMCFCLFVYFSITLYFDSLLGSLLSSEAESESEVGTSTISESHVLGLVTILSLQLP